MKVLKIIIVKAAILTILPAWTFGQYPIIHGTYLYSDNEYMQIDNDRFQIVKTKIGRCSIDFVDGDSIAAHGKIESVTNDFIKLTAHKDSDIYKSTMVLESYDGNIKDSVKIRFHFPFRGRFRISASLGISPETFTESNSITIPKKKYPFGKLYFRIYNLNLKNDGLNGEYLGRIYFSNSSGYEFKDKKANSLLINIPDLTNNYFAQYFINGEYAKIEKDKLLWRNRVYYKLSDELIFPQYDGGDGAIDETDGVDWIDELKIQK